MSEKNTGEKHEMKMEGSGMVDEAVCSCGWRSGPFFDGREYAEALWKKHLTDILLSHRKEASQ